MSEQLKRPPTSGPGSGAAAWLDYAVALTGTPADEWAALSRDEIVAKLDAAEVPDDDGGADAQEQVEQPDGKGQDGAVAVAEGAAAARGPVWMVPTDDGMVPETVLRARQRRK